MSDPHYLSEKPIFQTTKYSFIATSEISHLSAIPYLRQRIIYRATEVSALDTYSAARETSNNRVCHMFDLANSVTFHRNTLLIAPRPSISLFQPVITIENIIINQRLINTFITC